MIPGRPISAAIDAHVVGRQQTGNETYVVNVVRALMRRSDVDPIVYVDQTASWPDRDVPAGLARLRSPIRQLRIVFELPYRVKRDRADLLHVQYVAPLVTPVPTVVAIHDVSFEDVPGLFPRLTELRLRSSIRWSAQRAAAILALSEYTRSRIVHHYDVDPAKVIVAPAGVDPKWRPVEGPALDESLAGLDLPDRFVLYVGNLHPRKNVPRLVRAIARVRAAVDPDLGLVLAGKSGWRASEVDRAIHDVGGLSWVRRLGYVPEKALAGLYTRARAVAYLSLYEGFGLPALEALACGATVVASATTAIPEATGGAAILVDPEDDDQIADGLERAVADEGLRSRLRAAGLARAEATTWELCAERTVQAYRLALAV